MKENLVKRLTDTIVWRVVRWPLLVIASFALLFLLREIEGSPTWELLDLLIIPAVLAVGAWWLNMTQREAEREEAEKNREEERELARQNREEEREIARNRREQETLESYFDRMAELLIERGMRRKILGGNILSDSPTEELATVARARTLAVLRNLGPERRGHVVQFLYEARLIDKNQLVIDLDGANLEGATLAWVDLQRANLEGVYLQGAKLVSAQLKEANLFRAKMVMADLRWARLQGADLSVANLESARMRAAWLQEAELGRAKLQRADLRKAKLELAKLRAANLAEANMQGSSLNAAKLEGAFLKEANLEGAVLTGANLEGANLEETKLERALYDSETVWPEGFDPKAAGAILVNEDGNPVEDANE